MKTLIVTEEMLTESKDRPGWWEWEGVDTKEKINIELPGKNIIVPKLRTSGYIVTGGWNIDMGGGNINTGGGYIATRGGDIDTGGGHIETGGGYIFTHGGNIYTDGGNIYTGGGNIETGGGNIETLGGDIYTLDGDIETLGGDIKAKKITAGCLYYNLIYPPLCDDLNIESIRLPSQAKPYFESVLGFKLPACWDEIEEQLKPMIPELLKREDLKHFRWILEIMQGNDK